MHGLGLALCTGEDLPETPAAPIERAELKKDTDDFKRVITYVQANKSQPFDTLIQQVSRKYVITAPIQKELQKTHSA